MAWNVTADLSTETGYAAATAWLEARIPVTKEVWTALGEGFRQRAFTVAGVAQLDVIQSVLDAVTIAVAQGETLDDFKARVAGKLAAEWGESLSAGQQASRLETIFRNAVQQSYNAGRYALATTPAVLSARPFWMFDAVLDSRTTAVCRASNGKVAPASSVWWATHYPPLHHRCRSSVRTLTQAQADELGVTDEASLPAEAAGAGFGALPGASPWQPDAADYDPTLWAFYQAKIASV